MHFVIRESFNSLCICDKTAIDDQEEKENNFLTTKGEDDGAIDFLVVTRVPKTFSDDWITKCNLIKKRNIFFQ